MHIVLRSTKAVGGKSFRVPRNAAKVTQILNKFTARNGIRMHSVANSGNHLHLHLKLGSRHSYKPFIRAVTSAIATAIHGRGKFWDHRPFSRVVRGLRAFLRVRDYLHINQMEMFGLNRQQAREIVRWRVSRGLLEAPG